MWKKYTKFATKCPLSEISELRATFVAPIDDATRSTIMGRTTHTTKELDAKRPIMGQITHTTKELDAKGQQSWDDG